MTKSIELKQRLEDAGVRYWAGDNIFLCYAKR